MNPDSTTHDRPRVSVCFITYNHEAYVRAALDSVLMQRTRFPFEVVVGDDCSTDATGEILEDYRRRFPSRIRILPTERNLGVTANFERALQACRGQYVALLEGDDLWTDPSKLDRQVTYLDAHPEMVLCFHPVATIDTNGEPVALSYEPPRFRRVFSVRDLLSLGNFVPTCSAVFRNGVVSPLPPWFRDVWIADFPLHVLHAQHGNLRLLRRRMGAYRVHHAGVFSGRSREHRWQEVLKVYGHLDVELGGRYHGIIESLKIWLDCVERLSDGEWRRARQLAARRLLRSPVNAQWIRAAATAVSPRLYRSVARSIHDARD